jgi:hypothetical protein
MNFPHPADDSRCDQRISHVLTYALNLAALLTGGHSNAEDAPSRRRRRGR